MILTDIRPGIVADCIRGNSIFLVYILEISGKNVVTITENDNKTHSLNSKWLLNFVDCSNILNSDNSEKKRRINEISQIRISLKEEVDIEMLWEFVMEEDSPKKLSLIELSRIYFGNEIDGNHLSAVYRRLNEDFIYFSRKNDDFIPNTISKIDEIRESIKKREFEKKRIENFCELLKNRKKIDDDYDDLSKVLLNHFYNMDEKPSKILKKIFSILKINRGQQVVLYNYLVKSGIIHKYHNFHLKRIGIREKFSNEVIECSEEICNMENKIKDGNFKDLTMLESFTIDDETTISYDDAFSIEIIDEKRWKLYIHIANPASFIKKNSPLYIEALTRGSSTFFPGKSIEMFPEKLSNFFFSLVENRERRTFTIEFLIEENEIKKYEIYESVVKIDKNLSYDNVDQKKFDSLDPEKYFLLSRFANVLREKREKKGAITFQRKEILLSVDDDEIFIEQQERGGSRLLIEELMILTNSNIAEFFYENKIPVIFRGQEPPRESEDDIPLDSINNILAKNFQLLIRMNPSVTGIVPTSHFSVGVEKYVQVTSPIRRFTDLLHNYQLISFLRDEKLFSYSEIEEEHLKSTTGMKDSSIAEKFRRKFLILLYAKEHNQEIYDGVVVGRKRKPLVMVEKLNFTTECINLENKDVKIGDELKVKPTNIDFLGGFMKFEKIK